MRRDELSVHGPRCLGWVTLDRELVVIMAWSCSSVGTGYRLATSAVRDLSLAGAGAGAGARARDAREAGNGRRLC